MEKKFQISNRGEVCLALGGDGTFLRAAKKFACPILHIRGEERDSLGFHAETTLSNIKEVTENLKQGKYIVEKHSKLRITFQDKTYEAVNDVILFRASAQSIHFEVSYYDDEGDVCPLYPGQVRGDGIIFTQQIGSTAYNYFSGGPILFDIEAVVATPVSANYKFSIVTNKNFYVQLKKHSGVLECDGTSLAKLHVGDSFLITRSDRVVKVIKLRNGEKLSEKLKRLENF